ncbi:MAG: ABC transporter ATP-binding protein/permease, partial [Candidatus Sumerlaeia bacterium]|nr:ABC transporter ATP-binding protein/permease [Candidatus Sumerlaeia bacterium]
NESLRKANIETVFHYALFFPLVSFINSLGVALILWWGGGLAVKNFLSLGSLFLFIQLIQRFFDPIQDLSERYNVFQSAMASAERIFRLFDTETEVAKIEPQIQRIQFNEALEFKNVWFAYNHNDWVLQNVSFTMKKGERLAIVGATGAGKTTIISLLCRFYDPVKGSICLDGKDIRSFAPHQIRSLFGVVLQDVFLFSTSVKENIRLWEETLTDEKLRLLADFVNASSFIDQLPEKFDENVRERGGRLSTGQRQLLSFARALAADPQILILDEATATIDTETEQLIQEAIDRLLHQRTAIIIAHRLSTIKHADKIIVLHHGKVVETGTHNELLARNGIYRRLYELQFKEGLNSS